MSSTRRTRLAGLDPEAAPELAVGRPVVVADLLGEEAADAELARRLEGQDDPAGRRAGDQVDESARRRARGRASREEAAQLARRGRILEDLELLDVGVAVAAALEQEMALAERARAPEQRLGAERDGVAQRLVERRSDGGHGPESTRAERRVERTDRVDPADLGDLVEGSIRADDRRDALVDARRDVDEVARGEARIAAGEPGTRRINAWVIGSTGANSIHASPAPSVDAELGTPDAQEPMQDLLDDLGGRDRLELPIADPDR